MSANLEELSREELIAIVKAVRIGFSGCDLCIHAAKPSSQHPCSECEIANLTGGEDHFELDIEPVLKMVKTNTTQKVVW